MRYLEWTVLVLVTVSAILAAGHAMLHKREPRAALGWIAFCMVFPLVGPFSYFLFGINRIRTRARKLHGELETEARERSPEPVEIESSMGLVPRRLRVLARISDAVSRHPLVPGNAVVALHNGEGAYPVMLEAIESAESSVLLASYIFDADDTGQKFIDALVRAKQRGVDVRVLLDGYGEIYSSPSPGRHLRARGVPLALFIPPKLFPPTWHINLRSHRKILVTDGRVAFVGGMNIGDRHLAGRLENDKRVVDIHFRLEGPIVGQIARVFREDWEFAARESLDIPEATTAPVGDALCRTITEGPNEDLDRLVMLLIAAIGAARHRIRIMTPYFLPSREMIAVLLSAALRGIEVTIVLPGKNNLPYVHWAMRNMLWELLERGVRVYFQPPPFVHSKLFLIDDHYVVVGSANLDPRSLRLNFELAVEIFHDGMAREIAAHFDEARSRSHEVTLEEIDARSFPVRLRDGMAWLFSPYM